MPEGPEIYVETKYLAKKINNDSLIGIKILSNKIIVDLDKIEQLLPLKITRISSRGKKTIIELEGSWFLVFSFGLTGEFVFPFEINDGYVRHDSKHFMFEFILENNGVFYFSDVRRFGNVKIFDIGSFEKYISELGPDLIQDKVTPNEWYKKSQSKKNINITNFLMKQKFFSGIGNAYKSEILYKARIYPFALMKDLDEKTIKKLLSISVKVLKDAVEQLENKGKREVIVYEQKRDLRGNSVKAIETPDKRTTYYVPDLQIIGKKSDIS